MNDELRGIANVAASIIPERSPVRPYQRTLPQTGNRSYFKDRHGRWFVVTGNSYLRIETDSLLLQIGS